MALKLDKETQSLYLSLGSKERLKIDSLVGNFNKKIKDYGNQLIDDVSLYVNDRKTLSNAAIVRQLANDQKENLGVFGAYSKNITRSQRSVTYDVQNFIFFRDMEDELGYGEKTLYTWTAVFVRTCKDCIALHGTTKTMKSWEFSGTPKYAGTVCDGYCQCVLLPNEVMPDKAELRNPLRIKGERIRKEEKKRGKKYSPAYREQIVGNLNNPDFRKTLKKLKDFKKVE